MILFSKTSISWISALFGVLLNVLRHMRLPLALKIIAAIVGSVQKSRVYIVLAIGAKWPERTRFQLKIIVVLDHVHRRCP